MWNGPHNFEVGKEARCDGGALVSLTLRVPNGTHRPRYPSLPIPYSLPPQAPKKKKVAIGTLQWFNIAKTTCSLVRGLR